MAKQAIERTLEKAQRGLPASSFTRGELARKDEALRYAHPAIEPFPARARPTRMCLGCRERAAQGDLIRIFSRHSDSSSLYLHGALTGEPAVDLSTNKKSWFLLPPSRQGERSVLPHPVSLHGRSAYVHSSPSCFKSACIAQRLQRAFREAVSMERARELMAALEAIEALERVIDEKGGKKTTPSKNVTKVLGMKADLQRCGGEASTETEQIKREAKE